MRNEPLVLKQKAEEHSVKRSCTHDVPIENSVKSKLYSVLSLLPNKQTLRNRMANSNKATITQYEGKQIT